MVSEGLIALGFKRSYLLRIRMYSNKIHLKNNQLDVQIFICYDYGNSKSIESLRSLYQPCHNKRRQLGPNSSLRAYCKKIYVVMLSLFDIYIATNRARNWYLNPFPMLTPSIYMHTRLGCPKLISKPHWKPRQKRHFEIPTPMYAWATMYVLPRLMACPSSLPVPPDLISLLQQRSWWMRCVGSSHHVPCFRI